MKLAAFQKTLPTLPPHLLQSDYLIPELVQQWGSTVGIMASSVASEWTEEQTQAYLVDQYKVLCQTAAQLLQAGGIDTISPEAQETARHRWAVKVDPWISVSTRIDSVFLSYRQEEHELTMPRAEKLWAALEYRCQSITGRSFTQVLSA